MYKPVIVVVAAHHKRQKAMGNHHNRGVCQSTLTTFGRHRSKFIVSLVADTLGASPTQRTSQFTLRHSHATSVSLVWCGPKIHLRLLPPVVPHCQRCAAETTVVDLSTIWCCKGKCHRELAGFTPATFPVSQLLHKGCVDLISPCAAPSGIISQ